MQLFASLAYMQNFLANVAEDQQEESRDRGVSLYPLGYPKRTKFSKLVLLDLLFHLKSDV
jgi:hypothetical protein